MSPSAQRHSLVDALRGLALLGILIVNLEFIAVAPFRGWEGFDQWWDLGARWITITFFQLKSYLVFALLFGYGLSIMLGRRDDAGFQARYLRRMAVLLILGVLHAVFLFVGDILISYAILGAALLGVGRWPARRLLRLAIALYALAIALVGLVALEIAAGSTAASGETARAAVYADGSFLEVARQRLEDLPIALGVIGVLNWASIAAAFCVGVVLGRGDVLSRPDRHQIPARRLARWCLPIGFGLSGLAGILTLNADARTSGVGPAIGLLIENVAAPIAVAGVVAGLVVTSQARWWPSLERRVTAGGRSSLSMYLGESLVASLIFCGYGLGLLGTIGPLAALGVAVALWTALEICASLWLRRHRQGPAEWLLRSVTYWRRQRMLRGAVS